MTPPEVPWAAVVLAGGTSRRWGGVDKTAVPLAGVPLLVHAVRALLPGAETVAVVAPDDHPARAAIEAETSLAGRTLVWTREDPPGGGPVAGLAAGVRALSPRKRPRPDRTPDQEPGRVLAVLAGDHPFSREAWPRLLAALAAAGRTADAAIGVGPDGHRQPLLAVYRETALRDRLAAVPTRDQPLRVVTGGLRLVQVPVSAAEALDLDTAEDAEKAARLLPCRAGPPR